jgi:nucleoside-diphosphate-sugar epimerase
MKYIVTGGWFYRFYLVEALAESHDVVVIDNFSSGNPKNLIRFTESTI